MSDFAIGCFGKLPIYPDFIRHNASNPEIAWLDQWFQEGILFSKSKLGQGWAETFNKAEPWNFLFHPDNSGHLLLGIFIPSRDQGGRLYPFFLFMRIDHAGFHMPGYFAPAYFSSFLDDAWNMAHGGWKDMDMKAFLSAVEGMCVRIDGDSAATRERYLRHLQDNNVKGFFLLFPTSSV